MDAPAPPQTIEALLASILQLSAEVLAKRKTWSSSPAEQSLLTQVATLTGHTLPPGAFTSATAALAFLLVARFALEGMLTVSSDSAVNLGDQRQQAPDEDAADD